MSRSIIFAALLAAPAIVAGGACDDALSLVDPFVTVSVTPENTLFILLHRTLDIQGHPRLTPNSP